MTKFQSIKKFAQKNNIEVTVYTTATHNEIKFNKDGLNVIVEETKSGELRIRILKGDDVVRSHIFMNTQKEVIEFLNGRLFEMYVAEYVTGWEAYGEAEEPATLSPEAVEQLTDAIEEKGMVFLDKSFDLSVDVNIFEEIIISKDNTDNNFKVVLTPNGELKSRTNIGMTETVEVLQLIEKKFGSGKIQVEPGEKVTTEETGDYVVKVVTAYTDGTESIKVIERDSFQASLEMVYMAHAIQYGSKCIVYSVATIIHDGKELHRMTLSQYEKVKER